VERKCQGVEKREEVEDDPYMWVPHVSGRRERREGIS
jgi:hypothetical protein